MDGNLPGCAVHGIFQARILEWAAISFSRGSSQPKDWTRVSCIADRHFTVWATWGWGGFKFKYPWARQIAEVSKAVQEWYSWVQWGLEETGRPVSWCHATMLMWVLRLPPFLSNARGLDFYGKSPHFSSVQFSHSVVSSSLRPHELQHARSPCPLPTPGVYPNSCPLSQWCHPTISSSVVPFSSCPQSFPAWGSFPMSQLFALVAKVLEFQLQYQSFQWTPRTDLL